MKLNEDDILLFNEISNQLPANFHLDYKAAKSESNQNNDSSKSDAQRGTYVHGLLENFIKSRGEKEFFFNKSKDELAFNFGRDLVTPYLDSKEHTLLSEKELKFDLFTQKISPSLIWLYYQKKI